MTKIIVIGGGWAGVSAAVTAAKTGAKVQLLERTDMLLGCGNVGGIMRNNGRFTAAEENIAMGAGELFEITDRCATHRNVNFPGHSHAAFYDVQKTEPAVRRLLREIGVELRFMTRITEVETCLEAAENGGCRGFSAEEHRAELSAEEDLAEVAESTAYLQASQKERENRITALKTADGETFTADIYIDCTGTTGPMGNCMEFGNGCSMCVLRCPAFGPRVSISVKAGGRDYYGKRADGTPGAFSGSVKLDKATLSEELQKKLSEKGVAEVPLPEELINRKKLDVKVCRQYALSEFAENIILLDTGYAKMMTPYFPLDQLRTVPGFENVRLADPYAGGKGNSVRYMAITERDEFMRVRGVTNLFCGGEKSGPFIGHTEAISTGALAGHNAGRLAAWIAAAENEEGPQGAAQRKALLSLPETTAVGALLRYVKPGGGMFTFAGDDFFVYMKEKGLYTVDRAEIADRIERAGLSGVYDC